MAPHCSMNLDLPAMVSPHTRIRSSSELSADSIDEDDEADVVFVIVVELG